MNETEIVAKFDHEHKVGIIITPTQTYEYTEYKEWRGQLYEFMVTLSNTNYTLEEYFKTLWSSTIVEVKEVQIVNYDYPKIDGRIK
jgi:hypothetical protein